MSESAVTSPVLSAIADSIARDSVRHTTVVVGVSGGADSVALLRGLVELKSQFSISLVIGHLDHQLRTASPQEAAWVQALGRQLAVTVEAESVDIAQRARESGQGIEETARFARREFLQRIAQLHQAKSIALAHSADDQVETVLHHLVRGTGLAGLAGMSPLHQLGEGYQLWRPLLTVSRSEIESYLNSLNQSWQVDDSNLDLQFTRNRIRHELLPMLRDRFNPQVDRALLQLATIGGETQDFVEGMAQGLLNDAVQTRTTDRVELNVASLVAQPAILIREMCVELWRLQQWSRQGMTKSHWQRLANLLLDPDPRTRDSISLPHQTQATRRRLSVVIEQPPASPPNLSIDSTGTEGPRG